MSERNDGGWAFPNGAFQSGMSLRDWFAGQAMLTAALSIGDRGHPKLDPNPADITTRAYAIADAMIAERSK